MNEKTIWITGGSTGIGKALAIKFAAEGWNVAVSARRAELLNELTLVNKNIHSFPLDVTDIKQCKEVFKNITNKFDNINICIFGTGIHDPNSEKVFNLDKIRKIMEVNFFGVMNSVNSIYKYFSEKKNGQISIISSVAGYRGLPAAGA
jgi:NADP-dependent 3-hydroxy acid dehydrogenase YdfG